MGGRVVPVELDVTRPEQIARLADLAPDVQLLVNNAGVLASQSVVASRLEQLATT